MDVSVVAASLELDPRDGRAVVLLVHRETARVFPLWIGDAQASAIARLLRGAPSPFGLPRDGGPLGTTAVVEGLLDALGAALEEVRIIGVRAGVVEATLQVRDAARRVVVAAQAGDAIVLALRRGCRIVVPEELMAIVSTRVEEAQAKTRRRSALTPGGSAEPVHLTHAERWSQLLAHLSSQSSKTYEG